MHEGGRGGGRNRAHQFLQGNASALSALCRHSLQGPAHFPCPATSPSTITAGTRPEPWLKSCARPVGWSHVVKKKSFSESRCMVRVEKAFSLRENSQAWKESCIDLGWRSVQANAWPKKGGGNHRCIRIGEKIDGASSHVHRKLTAGRTQPSIARDKGPLRWACVQPCNLPFQHRSCRVVDGKLQISGCSLSPQPWALAPSVGTRPARGSSH